MSQEIMLQMPDDDDAKRQGSQMVTQAQELVIDNDDTYEHAGAWLQELKSVGRRLMERLDAPCKKAHEAWKLMVKVREDASAPFQTAESIVKQKMGKYQWDIAEKRRKEEEAARRKAEKEAQEKRAREIAEAKRLKDKEAVEALKIAPIEVAAVEAKTPEAPKVDGVSYRKVWKVQSVDPSKLPQRYLMPDIKAIESTVRGLGAKHGIPGVTVVEETITSVRSR